MLQIRASSQIYDGPLLGSAVSQSHAGRLAFQRRRFLLLLGSAVSQSHAESLVEKYAIWDNVCVCVSVTLIC